MVAFMMEMVKGLFFLIAITAEAHKHFVEVDLVGVEFGAVDAGEACFSAYGDSAGSAHAGTVDHDGVEAGLGGDVVFFGKEGGEFHHDGRTDDDTFIDFFAQNHLFHAGGDQSLPAIGAVVGHDDHLVGPLSDLFFKDDQVLVSGGDHGDHAVARFFEGFDDGEHGGDAHAPPAARMVPFSPHGWPDPGAPPGR